jgi:hypothetical protein
MMLAGVKIINSQRRMIRLFLYYSYEECESFGTGDSNQPLEEVVIALSRYLLRGTEENHEKPQ